MIEERLFDRGMLRLVGLFAPASKVSDDLRRAYRFALRDLTDDEWRRAVVWAQSNCTRMPLPADLRRAVGHELEAVADPPKTTDPPPRVRVGDETMTMAEYRARFHPGEEEADDRT